MSSNEFASGMTIAEIAEALHLTPRRVRTILQTAYNKLRRKNLRKLRELALLMQAERNRRLARNVLGCQARSAWRALNENQLACALDSIPVSGTNAKRPTPSLLS